MVRPPPRLPRHRARRWVQGAALLGGAALPWLDGFRLDIPAGRIVLLGRAHPLALPWALGLIAPFVVLVWTLAFLSRSHGRVFCGWACPYGSLVELCGALGTALGRGSHRRVSAWRRRSPFHRVGLFLLAALAVIVMPTVISASIAAYIYPPVNILGALFHNIDHPGMASWILGAWILLADAAFLAGGFLVRFDLCRMVCIYGMGQSMAASSADPARILRPRYLPGSLDACGACRACLKACYIDLDPRSPDLRLGFGEGCFNCGDCVDICALVQGSRQAPSLLSFARPAPPRAPRASGNALRASLEEDPEG